MTIINNNIWVKKILIIEDDIGISSSLKLYLENSNYEVFLHWEWSDAIKKILELNPDLIILDLNLPWKSWDEIIVEYRKQWNIPVIMLTARSWELDKINWLELWADDYIPKPFSPRELLARINTILRRASSDIKKEEYIWNIDILKCKDIEVSISKKSVTKAWNQIILTSNEFDILKKLIEEKWKIVSRETIMKDIIWYDNYLYDRTVDTHIKNIRKKLDEKDLIVTIRWEWYRINI